MYSFFLAGQELQTGARMFYRNSISRILDLFRKYVSHKHRHCAVYDYQHALSGFRCCGRNWYRNPILSWISPTKAVNNSFLAKPNTLSSDFHIEYLVKAKLCVSLCYTLQCLRDLLTFLPGEHFYPPGSYFYSQQEHMSPII